MADEIQVLRRMLSVVESELQDERNRSREMHLRWLADMDAWAEREAWLQGQIPDPDAEPETPEAATDGPGPEEAT